MRRSRLRGPPRAAAAADEDGRLVTAAAVAPTPDGEAATGTPVAAAAAVADARVTAAGAPREEMRRGDGTALPLPPPAEAVTELGEEAGVKLPWTDRAWWARLLRHLKRMLHVWCGHW